MFWWGSSLGENGMKNQNVSASEKGLTLAAAPPNFSL